MDLDFGIAWEGQNSYYRKIHMTDLVICSHSIERKTPPNKYRKVFINAFHSCNVFPFQIKHSVRGCIRNMTVSEDLKDSDDITMVRGVDRCFSEVEFGAHFSGNSYAIIGLYTYNTL